MVSGWEFSNENLSQRNVSILLEKRRMKREVAAFYKEVSGENRRQGLYESWQTRIVHPRDIKSQIKPSSGVAYAQ